MAKILVIEDNPELRENTAELLELEGHTVHTAVNGTAGLALAKAALPDLILCDIMMPDTDGFEVFRELKKHPPTASIPFLFVTANAEKRELKAGLEMGADGYIRKPFELEELLGEVRRCLEAGKSKNQSPG